MEGGSVSLRHTEIWNTPKPALPTGLTAQTNFGERSVTLGWDDPLNPSITHWDYQMKQGPADWGDWLRVDPSDWSTTSYTAENLTQGVTYQFKVQAVNWSGTAESEAVEVALAGPPDPPEVMVTPGHEEVTLSWTPGVTTAPLSSGMSCATAGTAARHGTRIGGPIRCARTPSAT